MSNCINNRYNIAIRRVISDKYIECSKHIKKKHNEYEEISRELSEGKSTISYNAYLDLRDRADYLLKEIEHLSVELDTWDKAREICLNVIDE